MPKNLIVICLLALIAVVSSAVSARTPAPISEQLQLLQQLSPEQRAEALRLLQKKDKGMPTRPYPVSEPQIVKPRSVQGESAQTEETAGDVLDQPDLATRREAEVAREALKQFGYDLFAGTPTTFAPATDIPVPLNYVVGPGDTVQVQLFGKENAEYALTVTREGELQFPGIGPITVAGLTFREMKAMLSERIARQMIGVKASITMGPLRSIRVFVLGDAYRPGSYTVSALSTMTNALFYSGGIRRIGSLRDIQLKRAGKIVTRLDLYDLLLRGDTSGDTRLQPGDVIFVPPIGKTAGIAGEVRRPAVYELRKEKTVRELLEMAGGLLPTAYPQAAQIERIGPGGGRELLDLDLRRKEGLDTRLRNGDVLRVYSVLEKMENIVLLSGHVERPGGYQWRKGMRLTDLIPSVDDLLPKPDLDYVLIRRELPPDRRIQVFSARLGAALQHPESEDNVYLRPRDRVIVFSLPNPDPNDVLSDSGLLVEREEEAPSVQIDRSIAQRPGEDQSGAVVTDRREVLRPILLELRQQASLGKPARVVEIGGRVRAPGQYPLEPGMRISDLIRAAGGLHEAAYVLEAELTRYEIVDGKHRETEHIPVPLAALQAGDASADILLRPHDHLTIREIPQWGEQEVVEVAGEVRFPGRYPIRRGETLRQLLQRAGGLTDQAFPDGAVFLREELRRKEQAQMDQLAAQLEADLAALQLSERADDSGKGKDAAPLARSLLAQLQRTKAAGRLVIDLPGLLRGEARAEHDVLLRGGDKLFVPRKTQEVTVIGEVHYPTSHIYSPDMRRDDYIDLSGGFTYKADKKRVYIVRANGSVAASSASVWFGRAGQEIRPGDTIVVPLDAERLRPLTLWTNISQILYQLGVAAAAWQTVGVF